MLCLQEQIRFTVLAFIRLFRAAACLICCRFIPLLGELLDCPHTGLRCAATDVLNEVVSKRMEPTSKIALVEQLKVVEACERLSANLVLAAGASKAASTTAAGGGGGNAGANPVAVQQLAEDQELLSKYAKLLATLAGEVMDSLKRIENGECIASVWLAAVAVAVAAAQPVCFSKVGLLVPYTHDVCLHQCQCEYKSVA